MKLKPKKSARKLKYMLPIEMKSYPDSNGFEVVVENAAGVVDHVIVEDDIDDRYAYGHVH